MSNYLGDFPEDATITITFTSNDKNGGAIAPSSAFEAADISIYKDGSATQKTTTNGVTMTSPFDSVTGLHLLEIDTSDDTGDAGFWTTGSDYDVVLNPDETVDSETVVACIAKFSIENRYAASLSVVPTADQNAAAVWDKLQSAHTTAGTFGEIATEIANILTDTDELQTNQGDWVTATGFAVAGDSMALTSASIDLIWDEPGSALRVADSLGANLRNLFQNQGNWLTATGFSTHSAADVYTAFGTGSNLTACLTATGFSTHNAANVADAVWDEATSGHTTAGTYGYYITDEVATSSDLATVDANVDAIKVTTDQFVFTIANQVDANALTGGGGSAPTEAEMYTYFTDSNREDVFKATIPDPIDANIIQVLGTALAETTSGNFATNWNTFWDNANALTAKTVDDVGGGAADAKLDQILGLLATAIVQSNADPSQLGYLEAYKDADYDGVAHPKKIWSVSNAVVDLTNFTNVKKFTVSDIRTGETVAVIEGTNITIVDPGGSSQAVQVGWANGTIDHLYKGKQYAYILRLETSNPFKFVVDSGIFKVLD